MYRKTEEEINQFKSDLTGFLMRCYAYRAFREYNNKFFAFMTELFANELAASDLYDELGFIADDQLKVYYITFVETLRWSERNG